MPLIPDNSLIASEDADGRLLLPAEVATRLGLLPGTSVLLDQEQNSYRVRRPIEQLAKVYIEPTSRCNLTCRTCIRNAWEEPQGDMTEATFAHLLAGLSAFDPLPTILFGGFGEPLAHPSIVEMVARMRWLGAGRIELITNGCLLSEETSYRLVEAGLDMLWVSLDGIRPESYNDVRLGAMLPQVLENLRGFSEVRRRLCGTSALPELGIAFVAMKRNIADLPSLLRIGRDLGACRFNISNVIPYTEDMASEILYQDSLEIAPLPALWHQPLRLPPMDVTNTTRRPLWAAIYGRHQGTLIGADVSGITRSCPFVEAGSVSISWQGNASPCQALMHAHDEFLSQRKRRVDRHVVANLNDQGLADIWFDHDYMAFRSRVQNFDFAPCIACGGCTMSDGNHEDCEDDLFPRCGACLWSHGLIRCP